MASKPPTRSPKGKPTKKFNKTTGAKPSGVSKRPNRTPLSGKQVKTKPGTYSNQIKTKTNPKPKARTKKAQKYTEKQLNLPSLNTITPINNRSSKFASVAGGTGKKQKTFVDDEESMMTILAMVNAEKEGQIESKMIKARQLEEIREARRKEAEAKEKKKRGKLESVMQDLKDKKKGLKGSDGPQENGVGEKQNIEQAVKKKKKVSFA